MTKFDVGQALDALSDFEYRVSEDPGFDTKLISIGETYGISGEDLADTIIAFAVRHHTTYVDQVLLQQLEQELAKKRAVKEKHEAAHKAKIIAPYRPPPESYKDGKDHEEFQDINTFSRKYREFAPVQNTMFHTDFLHREGINSEVTATTGQQYVDAKLTTEKIEVKLLSASPDHFFANDKAASVIEAKCDRMRSFSQLYFDANPQIGDWSRTLHPSESTIYVYGEVVREKTDLFHDGLLHIQLDNDVGTILPIDVSNLSKVTVFPGQIAAFGGIFTASEILEATEQLSLPKLAPMPITNPRSGMLKIVMAAGPFTNSEHLGFEPLLTLLDGIIDDAENAPNFLILHGPFVDRKNKSLFNKDLNVSATEVMDRLMANIGTKLTGIRTEVILQPSSTKDVSSLGSFPAPALNLEVKFGTKVHLVPDPAVIDVGGIRLALTSSEIVSHLSKAEFHKSDGTDAVDRITRLSNHLLDQRSLYPLSPSPIPIRLCDMLTVSKLDCAPHLLIVPSLLPPSVKVSDTTVVCNPGSLLRAKSGTYVEAHINLGKLGTEAAKFTEVSRFRVLRI